MKYKEKTHCPRCYSLKGELVLLYESRSVSPKWCPSCHLMFWFIDKHGIIPQAPASPKESS